MIELKITQMLQRKKLFLLGMIKDKKRFRISVKTRKDLPNGLELWKQTKK
jgi:hypothetical protein